MWRDVQYLSDQSEKEATLCLVEPRRIQTARTTSKAVSDDIVDWRSCSFLEAVQTDRHAEEPQASTVHTSCEFDVLSRNAVTSYALIIWCGVDSSDGLPAIMHARGNRYCIYEERVKIRNTRLPPLVYDGVCAIYDDRWTNEFIENNTASSVTALSTPITAGYRSRGICPPCMCQDVYDTPDDARVYNAAPCRSLNACERWRPHESALGIKTYGPVLRRRSHQSWGGRKPRSDANDKSPCTAACVILIPPLR